MTSRAELKYFLREDFKAYSCRLKTPNTLQNKLYNFFYRKNNLVLKFQRILRYLEFFGYKKKRNKSLIFNALYYLCYIKYRKLGYKLGFTIPQNVIDSGLMISHYGTIVISKYARIGKNCILHVCVNIGKHNGGAPQIGDNCFIGPGAKIFGRITIGDNVSIGANAVVNKSFPNNVVIAGIPAKIVKYKEI